MEEEPIGFVYLTTNLVNGKVYVGQHISSDRKGVDDYYLGSGGAHFLAAIKKYGRHNFKREILKNCYTIEELNASEREYSIKYNPDLDPRIGYNKFHGPVVDGENPSRHPEIRKKRSERFKKYIAENGHPWVGRKHTEEEKRKIIESNKRRKYTQETRDKMSASVKRYYEEHPEARVRLSEKAKYDFASGARTPYNRGKPLSAETRKKLSEFRKGKKMSEECRKKLSERMKGSVSPMKGRKASEETRAKLSASIKQRYAEKGVSEETRKKLSEKTTKQWNIAKQNGRKNL